MVRRTYLQIAKARAWLYRSLYPDASENAPELGAGADAPGGDASSDA